MSRTSHLQTHYLYYPYSSLRFPKPKLFESNSFWQLWVSAKHSWLLLSALLCPISRIPYSKTKCITLDFVFKSPNKEWNEHQAIGQAKYQVRDLLQHDVDATLGANPYPVHDETLHITQEEYVKILEDEPPKTMTDIQSIIKNWKGKGKLMFWEGHEFRKISYKPNSPHYQGSPAPLTDGPDHHTATLPIIESPQLPIADKAIVKEYIKKMQAQQERLALLNNPVITTLIHNTTITNMSSAMPGTEDEA